MTPRANDTAISRSCRTQVRWALLACATLALVLGPFLIFAVPFERWFTTMVDVSQARPMLLAALLIALLAGDPFLPVPSSIVSVIAGAAFGWWAGAAVVWLGMTLGCLLGYAMGASGGRVLAVRVVGETELQNARARFVRVSTVVLLLTRAIPVLAEASTVAAGMVRMPLSTFIISTTIANLIVAIAFAITGASGTSFLSVFFGLTAVPTFAWLLWQLHLRRQTSQAPHV